MQSIKSQKKWYERKILIAFVIFVHLFMVVWMSFGNSPNGDEPGQLAAGIYTLKFGRTDIYRVNPPLSRMIAAVPATYFLGIDADWLSKASNVLSYRPEFDVGASLFVKNDPQKLYYAFALGRLCLLPLTLLGAWTCFQFAKELFGNAAAFFALLFWCFNPYVLTWSATINPDLTAASVGIFIFYLFWKWCQAPNGLNTTILGGALGLLLVTETVWMIVFAVWPLLWFFALFSKSNRSFRNVFSQAVKLVTVFIIAILILNTFYNFGGSFRFLKQYSFLSAAFSGGQEANSNQNRFAESWMGNIPVPFPQDYIYGIDVQKFDLERGIPSYINGTWSEHGFWYYYLYALALKTPIGFQLLALISVSFFLLRKDCNTTWFNESVIFVPFISIFVFVSSQDDFSVHSRYILPLLPFLIIGVSRIGITLDADRCSSKLSPIFNGVVVVLSGWMIISVLSVFPHCMSYFNAFAGGPKNGGRFLLGSDLDWGQDVYYLEKWQKNHSDSRPLKISLSWSMPLENTKIKYDGVAPTEGKGTDIIAALKPGWYAVNVNNIFNSKNEFAYLRNEPVAARAGYSINIYHFESQRLDVLRKNNHLPSLAEEAEKLQFFAAELLRKKSDYRNELIKVAIYDDKGVAKDSQNAIEKILNENHCLCELIDVEAIHIGKLKDYDVFVVPGGYSNEMADKIGNVGKESIRDFVHSGGGYIGVCAGAYLASSTAKGFLGLVNVKTAHSQELLPRLEMLGQQQLGAGEANVDFFPEGMLLFSQPAKGRLSYINGPIFMEGGVKTLPDFLHLATYTSDIFQHHFQRGTMPKTPAIVAGEFGKGHVILFSPHPELTEGMESLLIDAVQSVRK